jgi:predicted nucleic acid-binding protein
MTAAYFDSSALAKLVLEEDGSDVAMTLWQGASVALTSRLGLPEVEAAMAATRRRRGLPESFGRASRAEWQRIRNDAWTVSLTSAIADTAGDLVHSHSLSGADAVHLASALAFGTDSVVMVTWDRRLAHAALAEGLSVVPAPAA